MESNLSQQFGSVVWGDDLLVPYEVWSFRGTRSEGKHGEARPDKGLGLRKTVT